MKNIIVLILIVTSLALGQYHINEESPFGLHPALVAAPGYPESGYSDAENIGIRWTRGSLYAFWFIIQPELSDTALDFAIYDSIFSAVPDSICILGNIAPQGGRDEGRCLDSSWLPVDSALYVRFVRRTIERYDGDGMDDMPGLSNPIKYWQVGNEPDANPRQHFARLQQMTYEAVKEADSSSQVLIGGATGFPFAYIFGYDNRFVGYLEELAGGGFDILDFHWYGEANGEYNLRDTYTGEDVLAHIRASLVDNGYPPDIPIWITEMGTYSGDPVPMGFSYDPPFQSERQQAGDMFKRYVYPLSRGVDKIFMAFGLIEGFKYDTAYFDFTGYIYDGWGPYDQGLGAKKLGYFTYKKMTEKLAGCEWDSSVDLSEPDSNVFICRVDSDETPLLCAWWDYYRDSLYADGDTSTIEIEIPTCDSAIVTVVVPQHELGIEIVDYATAFAVDTIAIVSDSLLLKLGRDPIIIETYEPVGIYETLRPDDFNISAHPNPFNSSVRITVEQTFLSVQNNGQTGMPGLPLQIEIFDMNGRRLTQLPAGEGLKTSHNFTTEQTDETTSLRNGEFIWRPDGSLPSGIYLLRAQTLQDNGLHPLVTTRRLVYLK